MSQLLQYFGEFVQNGSLIVFIIQFGAIPSKNGKKVSEFLEDRRIVLQFTNIQTHDAVVKDINHERRALKFKESYLLSQINRKMGLLIPCHTTAATPLRSH